MNFIIQIPRGFEVGPKRKVVAFEFIYMHAKFGEFVATGRLCFVISNLQH
jgi:hypothetical protein